MSATTMQAAALPFRTFTREDYFGYGGAELFDDGSAPCIAETTMQDNTHSAHVVVSGVGACVATYNREGEMTGSWSGSMVQALALRLPLTLAQLDSWCKDVFE